MKGGGVGVAQDRSVLAGSQIGVARSNMADSAGEFLQGGNLLLEADGCMFYIGSIDSQ